MKMALSRYKKVAVVGAACLVVCALVFAGLSIGGVFQSCDIISVSVSYDAEPYSEWQSNPHTYAITDEEDIIFLQDTLNDMRPLSGGGNCGFKQIMLYVTYADGREVDCYLAGDSCNTIAIGNPDDGDNHYVVPQSSLYEFRQRISRYIPALMEGGNWWLETLG